MKTKKNRTMQGKDRKRNTDHTPRTSWDENGRKKGKNSRGTENSTGKAKGKGAGSTARQDKDGNQGIRSTDRCPEKEARERGKEHLKTETVNCKPYKSTNKNAGSSLTEDTETGAAKPALKEKKTEAKQKAGEERTPETPEYKGKANLYKKEGLQQKMPAKAAAGKTPKEDNAKGAVRDEMSDIRSMTLSELTSWLADAGYPKFRAKQLYRWLHVSHVDDYKEMTNIPKAMAEDLEKRIGIARVRMIDRKISKIDGTQKFLFAMNDGALVEAVFMKYRYGNSVCISSQVGCRMGCRFCASTLDGLQRNLCPGEMLGEVYEVEKITGEKISHVVVMGTGEPLDNYDNLVRFLRMLTDEDGMNLSMRNVTVSTCGIVPRILDLADENLSITLALSLHATTDEKRKKIMPIANRYTIAELMDAVRVYFEKTGRRITFEYSLIAGVNDSNEDALELSKLAGSVGAHVNLIPVNPVKERGYRQPDRDAVYAFSQKLENQGINVSIRRVLGRDIDGACGQLRHRVLSKDKTVAGTL